VRYSPVIRAAKFEEARLRQCLVVDDSRVIRKVACNILNALGFDAIEADGGPAALDACRLRMPEAILLDLQMPCMSGAEFVRSLRRQAGGNGPFVVLCTTENDVIRLTEALNAGADEYVMKPFDHQSLAAKLAHISAA
jgi:two-component system chemotaxis response regulator CheY